jgi:hypothetical protein
VIPLYTPTTGPNPTLQLTKPTFRQEQDGTHLITSYPVKQDSSHSSLYPVTSPSRELQTNFPYHQPPSPYHSGLSKHNSQMGSEHAPRDHISAPRDHVLGQNTPISEDQYNQHMLKQQILFQQRLQGSRDQPAGYLSRAPASHVLPGNTAHVQNQHAAAQGSGYPAFPQNSGYVGQNSHGLGQFQNR